MPFLSVFFAHQGLTGSEIGLLSAVGPLMSLLVGPGITALGDRHAWRVRLLVLGLVGTALMQLVMPFPVSFVTFLPVMALWCAAAAPVMPIADGLIARTAVRRGLGYGRMRLWGSLSWAIVSALCGVLWEQWGFSLMFPLSSLSLFAVLPFAARLEEDSPQETYTRPPLKLAIGDVRLRVVLVATLVFGLAFAVSITFTGVYLDQVGGQVLVGLFYCVVALSELPMMRWSEAIMRHLGGPPTLVLSYLLLGCSYLGVALFHLPILLLGIGVIQGFGFGLFMPTTVRLVSDWGPPEWSSTSQGLMNAGLWGLAPLVAGPIAGVIFDALGPAAVFICCVGASLLAGLVVTMARFAGAFKRGDAYSGPVEQPVPLQLSE